MKNPRLSNQARPLFFSSRTVGAFTLIELLVVIAIIAILAGLLLPALAKAKDRTLLSIDRNNNHQILVATHMYIGDNQDYLPFPNWGWAESGWCYGANIPQGGGAGPGLGGIYSNQVQWVKKSESRP